eukprot:3345803-Pleurochrysis_carterae.AAC.4
MCRQVRAYVETRQGLPVAAAWEGEAIVHEYRGFGDKTGDGRHTLHFFSITWHVNPERVTLAGVFGDGSAWDLNDSSSFRLVKSEPSPNLETSDDTTVSESAASVEARTRTKAKAESARAAEAAAARGNDEPGAEGDGSVPPSDGEDERPESEK